MNMKKKKHKINTKCKAVIKQNKITLDREDNLFLEGGKIAYYGKDVRKFQGNTK